MEQRKNRVFFWVVNGLIALFLLVFIIQNRGEITFRFLGLKLVGYGFLVFLVIFLLGFLSGWLWAYFRGRRKKRQMAEEASATHYIEDHSG